MIREVEMARHWSVSVIQNAMAMAIHALPESLLCLANVLLPTEGTCYEVNKFGRGTGDVVENKEVFIIVV